MCRGLACCPGRNLPLRGVGVAPLGLCEERDTRLSRTGSAGTPVLAAQVLAEPTARAGRGKAPLVTGGGGGLCVLCGDGNAWSIIIQGVCAGPCGPGSPGSRQGYMAVPPRRSPGPCALRPPGAGPCSPLSCPSSAAPCPAEFAPGATEPPQPAGIPGRTPSRPHVDHGSVCPAATRPRQRGRRCSAPRVLPLVLGQAGLTLHGAPADHALRHLGRRGRETAPRLKVGQASPAPQLLLFCQASRTSSMLWLGAPPAPRCRGPGVQPHSSAPPPKPSLRLPSATPLGRWMGKLRQGGRQELSHRLSHPRSPKLVGPGSPWPRRL